MLVNIESNNHCSGKNQMDVLKVFRDNIQYYSAHIRFFAINALLKRHLIAVSSKLQPPVNNNLWFYLS